MHDIGLEAVAHGDGQIEPVVLQRYLAAYQEVTPLELGELWAVPIMLRLALIENLRRLAVGIGAQLRERELAVTWAEEMRRVAEIEPTRLVVVIAEMARSNPPMESSFVAEFARRLAGQGTELSFPLTWIALRLSESGKTIEQLIRAETRAQAADQISISNSITSLRLIDSLDWRDFVESQSLVERALREDPAQVYREMDFVTRDRYRHAVERIARQSALSQAEVAARAVQLAAASVNSERAGRTRHVGYYLIDRGRPELEREAEIRISRRAAIARGLRRASLPVFLGSIVLLTAVLTALVVLAAAVTGTNALAAGVIVVLSVFSMGIPSNCRTLVVVPTMLTSVDAIAELLSDLEVRFVANRDRHVHFGLLTDFGDAPRRCRAR